MRRITVLICDDHTVVREGLRALLAAAGDIDVVGEAGNGHESVRKTRRLRPDVVVLDLVMPLLNGIEAARQIRKEVHSTKVLVLSAYSDSRHVRRAIEAGASGYLMKETAGNDLLRAIREVQKGNAFFSPSVTKGLLTQPGENLVSVRPARTEARLTSRQTEVIQLIAEGYSNKQIAGVLSLSIKTVEKHRQTLMDKLNIHSIAILTRYALSSGVVESNPTPVVPFAAAEVTSRRTRA
jgi:DNA-binding NarL/FixJ family response regulator